jgi:hypothetical protein
MTHDDHDHALQPSLGPKRLHGQDRLVDHPLRGAKGRARSQALSGSLPGGRSGASAVRDDLLC